MKRKNQMLLVTLALIPGLGHICLGLYTKAIKVWVVIGIALLMQIIIVEPLILKPLLNIFPESSLLGNLLVSFLNILIWVYVWQIKDVYDKVDEMNYPNARKVLVAKKLNKK